MIVKNFRVLLIGKLIILFKKQIKSTVFNTFIVDFVHTYKYLIQNFMLFKNYN